MDRSAATGGGPSNALVGRGEELDQLRAVARSAPGRSGALCLVAGAAGMGKTRVVTELAEELAGGGAAVAWGRAWNGEGAPAYWPWSQVLRSVLRTVADDRPVDPYLARAMPGIRTAAGGTSEGSAAVPADGPVDGQIGGRFLVFEAVAEALRSAGSARPLALVFDDLHAADVASLQLLEFVAGDLERLPVTIIGTYRDQHPLIDPAIDEARTARTAQIDRLGPVVRLTGLHPAAVAALVRDRCGAEPPPDLVERLHRVTEGNPFFLTEIARLLGTDSRSWDGTGGAAAVPLPATLRTMVRSRVEALDPDAREVLSTASVLGEEFSIGPLTHATGGERATTLAALDDAAAEGLIRETGPLGTYRFAHALTREALYADLGSVRRAELHDHVGRALEASYASLAGVHAAELAEHFAHAATLGDAGPAVAYGTEAGDRAMAAFAYDDAARSYRMALDVLTSSGGGATERAELLLALAAAQTRGTACDAAIATYDEAARLAAAADRADLLGRAAVGATQAHFRLAGYVLDLDARLRVLEQAAAVTAGRGDPLEAMVLASLAWTRSVSSTETDALGLARRAVALADGSGDAVATALAHHALRWALAGAGSPAEKQAATSRLLDLSSVSGDLELAWWGHRWALFDALEACDPEAVAAELAQLQRLADALREPYFGVFVALFRASVAMLQGRLRDAASHLDDSFVLAEAAQVGPEHGGGLSVFLHREQGLLDMTVLAPLLDAFPDVPMFQALAAWGHANTGDLEAARLALRRLDGSLPRMPRAAHWSTTLATAADAAYLTGDEATAAAVAPLLAEAGDEAVVIAGPLIWTGSSAHYAGLALLTLGDVDGALEALAAGRAAHERIGATPLLLYSDAAIAHALIVRDLPGDAERSAVLLKGASQRADEIGLGSFPDRLAAVEISSGPVTVAAHPPPVPKVLQFVRTGDVWQVGDADAPVLVRHSLGMTYLDQLLASPGQEHHALDLQAMTGNGGAVRAPSGRELAEAGLHVSGGSTDILLDDQARQAYRQRYEDLSAELTEAESWRDHERTATARVELDALAAELARAVGLGGRARPGGSNAERARVNVTRAIRLAIDRIGEHDAALGAVLSAAVATGTYCRYEPLPGGPHWGRS